MELRVGPCSNRLSSWRVRKADSYAQIAIQAAEPVGTLRCMQWTEAYATGIPELDAQHQKLFAAVRELRDAIHSGAGADEYSQTLTFLAQYCRDHFAAEERCMEQHRCPAAAVNKSQHAGLLAMLAQHRRMYGSHGYHPHDGELLVTALEHWLHHHLGRVDRQLRQCVRSPAASADH